MQPFFLFQLSDVSELTVQRREALTTPAHADSTVSQEEASAPRPGFPTDDS